MNEHEAHKINIKAIYRVYAKADIAGKAILLIDDIVTTDSTLSEVAQSLLRGRADLEFAATFAKTPNIRKGGSNSQG